MHIPRGYGSGTVTDFYQITMAYAAYKLGEHNTDACFNLFFRRLPFGGEYAIACGLGDVIEYIESIKENGFFSSDDIKYLKSLRASDSNPIFTDESFFEYLENLSFDCSIYAVPEGTLVFANEPLIRVTGPIVQCQLLETALLYIMNFQTLIATKASRICYAAEGKPVLEFGLRRAQGGDGGLSASRAAYIGGCSATSNVLAARYYEIPLKGTHAHSWVMAFAKEETAFSTYAENMPNNCVFLVDTYNTENGIRHAIQQARKHNLANFGIRIDSGDLLELSKKARSMLNKSGFKNAKIIASNDLDEYSISKLETANAPIDIYGVGTKLITAYNQPALGGVYKMSAIKVGSEQNAWMYTLKVSDDENKTTLPGIINVSRFYNEMNYMSHDVIFDENDYTTSDIKGCKLLKKVFEKGFYRGSDLTYRYITKLRDFVIKNLKDFRNTVKAYPVIIDERLAKRRKEVKQYLIETNL